MRYPKAPGEGKKKKKIKDDLSFSQKERKDMSFITQSNGISWLFKKKVKK